MLLFVKLFLQITASKQIDIHARKSQLLTELQPYIKKLPQSLAGPSVKTATSKKGKSPSIEDSTKGSAGSTTFIVEFWNAAKYRDLRNAGVKSLQGVAIHDNDPCTADQQATAEQAIKTFIHQATLSNPRLSVKPGERIFDFRGECQAQWFPVYNYFLLRVENGNGRQCEDKCLGLIFMQSSTGFIDNENDEGENAEDDAVFDTTADTDYQRYDARNAALRSH